MKFEQCPPRNPETNGLVLLDSETPLHSVESVNCYTREPAPEISPDGCGTLHITSKRICWLSKDDAVTGWAVSYPGMTLHSVCKQTAMPHLFIMLDNEELPEVRLVTPNAAELDLCYQAMCEGSLQNPCEQEEQFGGLPGFGGSGGGEQDELAAFFGGDDFITADNLPFCATDYTPYESIDPAAGGMIPDSAPDHGGMECEDGRSNAGNANSHDPHFSSDGDGMDTI